MGNVRNFRSLGRTAAGDEERAFVLRWIARCGPRLHGTALYQALGYGSRQGFERAVKAGKLADVPLFPMMSGRGKYARTEDVALRLWRRVQPKGF